MSTELKKFRGVVAELIESGVYPSVTELARRGWVYPKRRAEMAVVGSGASLPSGRYVAARREVLLSYGYESPAMTPRGGGGRRFVAPAGRP